MICWRTAAREFFVGVNLCSVVRIVEPESAALLLTDWTVNGKTRARVKNSIRKVADFRMTMAPGLLS